MRVIGLTGGVGSGKSLVAGYLKERYQAELLITDELGHQVMEPGTSGYERILQEFGTAIVGENRRIDRTALADAVFQDPSALERLNQIIHPAVIGYIEDYIRKRQEHPGLIVLESALLFESGCDALCDEIWYVQVSETCRKKRLADSRGYTGEKTDAIMKRQLSEKEFITRSDVILENDGSVEELYSRINDRINV